MCKQVPSIFFSCSIQSRAVCECVFGFGYNNLNNPYSNKVLHNQTWFLEKVEMYPSFTAFSNRFSRGYSWPTVELYALYSYSKTV